MLLRSSQWVRELDCSRTPTLTKIQNIFIVYLLFIDYCIPSMWQCHLIRKQQTENIMFIKLELYSFGIFFITKSSFCLQSSGGAARPRTKCMQDLPPSKIIIKCAIIFILIDHFFVFNSFYQEYVVQQKIKNK